MGSGNLEFVFEKWGKEYGESSSWHSAGDRISKSTVAGPVNHVSVLGQHLVVLNSFDDAHELLDHRGGIYSSRPRLVTFSEMHAILHDHPPRTSDAYGSPNLGWDGVPSSLRCILGPAGENTGE